MRFQSENTVFKFLWCSVGGPIESILLGDTPEKYNRRISTLRRFCAAPAERVLIPVPLHIVLVLTSETCTTDQQQQKKSGLSIP